MVDWENRKCIESERHSFVDQFEDDTGIDTTDQSVRGSNSNLHLQHNRYIWYFLANIKQHNWNTYSGANSVVTEL